MLILALLVYAAIVSGLLFCVIAGAAKEQDSLIRKLDEAQKDARAFHALYQNAIHALGKTSNSQISTLNSNLPTEDPHAQS